MNVLTRLRVDRNCGAEPPGAVWLLLVVGLAAYASPWIVLSSSSLTLNGYDLAEWSSLHPISRAGNLPLLTSFLLRLPLLCLAVLSALLAAENRRHWIGWIMVFVVGIALFPPLEFLGGASGDPNYRQQFGMALTTWVGGAISLSRFSRPFRHTTILMVALLGLIGCVIGLTLGCALMRSFDVSVQPGLGGIGLGTVFLAIFLWQLWRLSQKQTRQRGERATLSLA